VRVVEEGGGWRGGLGCGGDGGGLMHRASCGFWIERSFGGHMHAWGEGKMVGFASIASAAVLAAIG